MRDVVADPGQHLGLRILPRAGGRRQQLPLSEPANLNAIHGLTRWINWTLLEATSSSARWGYRLHPQPVRSTAAGNPITAVATGPPVIIEPQTLRALH